MDVIFVDFKENPLANPPIDSNVILGILLVDGDHHGDGYVTIIVVNANKILVLPIRRVFVRVNTPLPRFCRE